MANLKDILLKLGLNLAQGAGEGAFAALSPEMYQQSQTLKRQRALQDAEFAHQDKTRSTLSAYEQAQLAAQEAARGDARQRAAFEDQLKLAGGVANGTLRQIGAPGIGAGISQQEVTPQPQPQGGDILSQLFNLPEKKAIPTLFKNPDAGAPGVLEAGGMRAVPVPGATEKDMVDFNTGSVDPKSPLGQQLTKSGLHGRSLKLPATQIFQMMEQAAQKQEVADREAEVKKAILGEVQSQAQVAKEAIRRRFSDSYYKNLHEGKVDPERDFQQRAMEARLATAVASGKPEQVASVMKDIDTLQTPWEKYQESRRKQNEQLAMQREQLAALRGNRDDRMLEASYNNRKKELDKVEDPIVAWTTRYSRLKDTVESRSPLADSLIAPELLTVMAGGKDSNFRMSEAEISRVIGGRSEWEELKSKINKWNLDPNKAVSFTDAQRKQAISLMDHIGKKMEKKRNYILAADEALAAAPSAAEHKKVLIDLKKNLLNVDLNLDKPRLADDLK